MSSEPALPAQPTHTVLRSPNPFAANLAGFAWASACAPELAVLEIQTAPGEVGIDWDGVMAPDRHLISYAGADNPPDRAWPLVRSDAREQIISYLPQFLAAPEASEQLLRQRFPLRGPMAILIANGWHVARQFPDDPATTARLMQVQREFGMSVVLAADRTERRDYAVFDLVFDVIARGVRWGATRLRCVQAQSGTGFRAGDEFALEDVAACGAALHRLAPLLPPLPGPG
ncbi:MAG: hypothetical protein L3K17_03485 [Thermoplasmata archaeon]|nr:hypothetical protein [Thermoplasmata archaeon]